MTENAITRKKEKRVYEWYLVYTEPQSEYHASHWLQRAGFMTFLPTYKPTRKGGKTSRAEVPVFANYVFVGEMPGMGRFETIEDTSGVVRLLRLGNAPIRVPDAAVEELRLAARNKQFLEDEKRGGVRYVKEGITAAALAKFKLYDKVLVTVGPFVGFVGQIVRMGGRNEIGVLLKLFNKETLVRFTEMQLQPAIAS